jgi:hypothetical protein
MPPPTKKTTTKPKSAPKAVKKTVKKDEPAKQEEPVNPHLGEFDAEFEYKLELRGRNGQIINLNGTMPVQSALTPAFFQDSQKTITGLVTNLVQNRFLLQLRHFFNTKQQAERQRNAPSDPIGTGTTVPSLPLLDNAQGHDSGFGFEESNNANEEDDEQEYNSENAGAN